jgi:hypothetical protein
MDYISKNYPSLAMADIPIYNPRTAMVYIAIIYPSLAMADISMPKT